MKYHGDYITKFCIYIISIILYLFIEVAPPRPPLPGSNIPPPRPPPPETDDEEEMFMHAPQPNQPIMVREMFDYSTYLYKNYVKLNIIRTVTKS